MTTGGGSGDRREMVLAPCETAGSLVHLQGGVVDGDRGSSRDACCLPYLRDAIARGWRSGGASRGVLFVLGPPRRVARDVSPGPLEGSIRPNDVVMEAHLSEVVDIWWPPKLSNAQPAIVTGARPEPSDGTAQRRTGVLEVRMRARRGDAIRAARMGALPGWCATRNRSRHRPREIHLALPHVAEKARAAGGTDGNEICVRTPVIALAQPQPGGDRHPGMMAGVPRSVGHGASCLVSGMPMSDVGE